MIEVIVHCSLREMRNYWDKTNKQDIIITMDESNTSGRYTYSIKFKDSQDALFFVLSPPNGMEIIECQKRLLQM